MHRSFKRSSVVGAVALVAGVLAGCSTPPPSLPGAGTCLPASRTGAYIRWDGQYGADTHLRVYSDAACTQLTGNHMAISGPSIPLPPGYSSWTVVPDFQWQLSLDPYVHQVFEQCKDAVPNGHAAGGIAALWIGTAVTVPNSLPTPLFACQLYGLPGEGTWPDQPFD